MQKLNEQDIQLWLIIDKSHSFHMYSLLLDVKVEFTWIPKSESNANKTPVDQLHTCGSIYYANLFQYA